MQDTDIPTKITVPWGTSASGADIRVVPVTPPVQAGAASFQLGFPPPCFDPSSGVGPFGQDFNGILNVDTAWSRWFQAGGPIEWDSSFGSAVGGYPKGAIVASSTTFGQFWYSTEDANENDPDTGGSGWQSGPYGLGSTNAGALAQSAAGLGLPMLNGQLTATVGTNALTIAVKTLAGNDPSATDPVWFVFRSGTPGLGTPVVIAVTAALSITVPAFSTLGFTNATPGRIWVAAVNSAGTVSLAVINCLSGTSIFPLAGWGIASITAFGGGANSAQVFYGAGALANVAYTPIGYATWEAGGTLATAGNWSATPTRLDPVRPGAPLPGTRLGPASNYSTTLASTISNSFVAIGITVALNVRSSANLVRVSSSGTVAQVGGSAVQNFLQLARGSTLLGGPTGFTPAGGASTQAPLQITFMDFPGASGSITYGFQAHTTSSAGIAYPPSGGYGVFLEAEEIQA